MSAFSNRDEGDGGDGGKLKTNPKVLIFPVYSFYPCLSDFIPFIPFIPVKSAFGFWCWALNARRWRD